MSPQFGKGFYEILSIVFIYKLSKLIFAFIGLFRIDS